MFKEIETFISNKKKGERVCVCVLWQPNKLLWAKRQQVFMFKETETFISNKKKGERVCLCVCYDSPINSCGRLAVEELVSRFKGDV